jgi:hypothetical protein
MKYYIKLIREYVNFVLDNYVISVILTIIENIIIISVFFENINLILFDNIYNKESIDEIYRKIKQFSLEFSKKESQIIYVAKSKEQWTIFLEILQKVSFAFFESLIQLFLKHFGLLIVAFFRRVLIIPFLIIFLIIFLICIHILDQCLLFWKKLISFIIKYFF